jgi:hypothetical protein
MNSGIDPAINSAATINAPTQDRSGIHPARSDRGIDRVRRADVAIDKHRHRGDADHQNRSGKGNADDRADCDQRPAPAGGEDFGQEGADARRRGPAEQSHVKPARGKQPQSEYSKQQSGDCGDLVEGGPFSDIEEMRPVGMKPHLAPARHFEKADGGHRPEQSHPGRNRQEQREERPAKRGHRGDDPDQRVEDHQEDDVAAHLHKIAPAVGQRRPEVAIVYQPDRNGPGFACCRS